MGAVIWVEVLSRHHDVVARHRCAGPEVRIGRGYDNDVVIDDPYVAPRHLRVVQRDDGTLVAEDAGSANGLFAESGADRQERLALDGERIIRIGRTRLRIREESQAVAPERVLRPPVRTWPAALVLAGVVLAMQMISMWLSETTEPKLSRYALPLLTLPLFVLAWTTGWAILSRIFAAQAQFGRHLFIALCGLLVFYLYSEFTEYGAFAFSWRSLSSYQFIGLWLLTAILCFFHLQAINPSRLRMKGGIVAALATVAIAMQMLAQSDTRSGYDRQNYVRRLKPPALRLAPLQNESAFFADAERLKLRLDRARKEESTSDGAYSSSGYDD